MNYIQVTKENIDKEHICCAIANNKDIIKKVIDVLDELHLEILSLEINESKICIMLKKSISDDILEELHERLI